MVTIYNQGMHEYRQYIYMVCLLYDMVTNQEKNITVRFRKDFWAFFREIWRTLSNFYLSFGIEKQVADIKIPLVLHPKPLVRAII